MSGFILRRILAVIPVMAIVAIFVFLLLRLTPGDPAAIIAGDSATAEQLERIRESLGLNLPLHVQFFTWLGHLLQGDLGTSLISGTSVTTMIGQRIWPTLNVALLTIVLSVAIAVPLGILAAWRHRSWIDYSVMTVSVLGFSIPVFVIGYLFIKFFAIELRWFPVQGYTAPTENFTRFLARAALPCFTLAVTVWTGSGLYLLTRHGLYHFALLPSSVPARPGLYSRAFFGAVTSAGRAGDVALYFYFLLNAVCYFL